MDYNLNNIQDANIDWDDPFGSDYIPLRFFISYGSNIQFHNLEDGSMLEYNFSHKPEYMFPIWIPGDIYIKE